MGKLHLKLEWLSLLSTPEKLEQVRPFIPPAAAAAKNALFLRAVQSGAAKRARGQKPGQ